MSLFGSFVGVLDNFLIFSIRVEREVLFFAAADLDCGAGAGAGGGGAAAGGAGATASAVFECTNCSSPGLDNFARAMDSLLMEDLRLSADNEGETIGVGVAGAGAAATDPPIAVSFFLPEDLERPRPFDFDLLWPTLPVLLVARARSSIACLVSLFFFAVSFSCRVNFLGS